MCKPRNPENQARLPPDSSLPEEGGEKTMDNPSALIKFSNSKRESNYENKEK